MQRLKKKEMLTDKNLISSLSCVTLLSGFDVSFYYILHDLIEVSRFK